MCAPAILAPIAIATQVFGGFQAASSAKAAGNAEGQYYEYQAAQNLQQAEYAKKIGEGRDTAAQDQAALEASAKSRDARSIAGAQVAAIAANGVGSGSVTAVDIASDTFNKAQLDQVMIRYNANLKSKAAKDQARYEAWDYTNQANLNKFSASNARAAGKANARASLLGTAGSVATSAYGFFNPARIN